MRWRASAVVILVLGLVSGIRRYFSMSMELSCVALMATVVSSASAKISSHEST